MYFPIIWAQEIVFTATERLGCVVCSSSALAAHLHLAEEKGWTVSLHCHLAFQPLQSDHGHHCCTQKLNNLGQEGPLEVI